MSCSETIKEYYNESFDKLRKEGYQFSNERVNEKFKGYFQNLYEFKKDNDYKYIRYINIYSSQCLDDHIRFTGVRDGCIDDLYKTPEERDILAETIHPLCKVRGVPGTHNIKLGLDVLNSLYKANSFTETAIPSFSKTQDKHLPEEAWIKFKGKPDFIFFDAWFGGAKPISFNNWIPPINKLEKKEDPDGIWSKWSNKELAGDYQNLFNKIDLRLMIKVPDMNDIFESRWLQEQTLKKTLSGNMSDSKIMNKDEVRNFVMHFDRLTRYVLEEIPKFADIVLNRDKNFEFSFVKKPLVR